MGLKVTWSLRAGVFVYPWDTHYPRESVTQATLPEHVKRGPLLCTSVSSQLPVCRIQGDVMENTDTDLCG